MAPITALTVDGTTIPLDRAVYDIQIAHGRSTVTDGPAASSCQITILLDTDTPLPDFGMSAPITVEAYGLPRFTGLASDARLTHPIDRDSQLTLTGTGPVADLGLVDITPTAWPQETSADRAGRILDAAGVTAYATSGTLEVLARTDTNLSTALQLLTDLGNDTGAAVFDTPDGAIVFQDLAGRAQTYVPDVWATTTGTWATTTGTWTQQESKAVADPVTIPANAIAWEPSLEQHRADIINRAIIEYGDPVAVHTEDDTASQTTHRTRAVSLRTQLADATAAQLRAEQLLTRLAWPRFQLTSVDILVDRLDDPTRDALMAVTCGGRVILQGLPDPSPAREWLGVVEGWAETYTVTRWTDTEAVEEHILTLALSDPRASFATVQWQDINPARTWSTIDTSIAWADVTLDADLAA